MVCTANLFPRALQHSVEFVTWGGGIGMVGVCAFEKSIRIYLDSVAGSLQVVSEDIRHEG